MPTISDLVEMLRYRRPAASKSERKFIHRFIDPYQMNVDDFGNRYMRIGTAPVMWSCHTDTVHRDGGKQPVIVENGMVALAPNSGSNCLGADDGAGVWIMLNMIEAGVEGLYVFHRAEEVGGLGSNHIVKHTPSLVEGIKACIAFDRYGTTEVITHQLDRCCSDNFAWSLCEQLTAKHYPSDAGLFTDSANYTDLIGECTNIAVGYWQHHSKDEKLDVDYISWLSDTMCNIDLDALVYEREPGEDDPNDFYWSRGYANTFAPSKKNGKTYSLDHDDELDYLTDIIGDHPDVAARLLADYGMTYWDFLEECYDADQRLNPRVINLADM